MDNIVSKSIYLPSNLEHKLKEARENQYTVLLGSNLGDRPFYLQAARDLLERKTGRIIAASSVKETEAWGKTDQPGFLNQVLLISSHMQPIEFLANTQAIENSLGRLREEKWGPRTIDIDILLFEDNIIAEPGLEIPHPRLHERVFTLDLLVEVVPDMLHPTLQCSFNDLLQNAKTDVAG